MRILLVVPPERFDFYGYLKDLESCELILLWHTHPRHAKISLDELPLKFSKIIFWGSFRTPYTLISQIRPDRVVFFEIIDLRQIALIIAARSRGVRTFYLEHGSAGDRQTAIERWEHASFFKTKLPNLIKRSSENFPDIISAKIFYYSVTRKFFSLRSYIKFFFLPLKMLGASPNKVLSHTIFPERVPDQAIVFSEINFEAFELYTGIRKNDALLTGVPFFDKYFTNSTAVGNHVVYIEHPYLEYGLMGWTVEHHKKLAGALNDFAVSRKLKLYIKLHPFSNFSSWSGYEFNKEHVEILQAGDFTHLYLSARLILGFSSSLITGLLCAKKNIVLLGWHPDPKIFGVDFSETGLCHVSFSTTDLTEKYEAWVRENLTDENFEGYEKFLRRCNYPFDGKASFRVINAIAGNEVS